MLRAPICTTSAYSAIAPAWVVSRNSVTIGSPVSSRASARIRSASTPSPLKANGDVRGLKAPPRSIEAPAALTTRATSSVCSRDSTVHGPAIKQKVELPPTRRPLISNTLGASCLTSSEASLYGREMGTTRSTPGMPSRPSSATPCGSPMAPMAVVSSPGRTSTWTPTVSSRARTAAMLASVASGVITIIMAGASQPELAHAQLVGAEVVRELVADGAQDLGAQLVRVVPEVAQQRVPEDDDAVRRRVARDRVPHVQAVRAVAAALVGDDHGDVAVQRRAQDVRQVVQGVAHELLEVLRVVR